jgi:hypothetical protein
LKAEKRFAEGGTLLASYTFSKVISNVETRQFVVPWVPRCFARSNMLADRSIRRQLESRKLVEF